MTFIFAVLEKIVVPQYFLNVMLGVFLCTWNDQCKRCRLNRWKAAGVKPDGEVADIIEAFLLLHLLVLIETAAFLLASCFLIGLCPVCSSSGTFPTQLRHCTKPKILVGKYSPWPQDYRHLTPPVYGSTFPLLHIAHLTIFEAQVKACNLHGAFARVMLRHFLQFPFSWLSRLL